MLKHLMHLSLFSMVISINGMELPKSAIRVPEKLGKLKLEFNPNNGFVVKQNKISLPVKSYDVDPLLLKMTPAQLEVFLEKNYIAINRLNNGDLTLTGKVRGLGGGPYTAYTVYFATKAALIAGLVTGTAAAVCATGGAAASAAGAIAQVQRLQAEQR